MVSFNETGKQLMKEKHVQLEFSLIILGLKSLWDISVDMSSRQEYLGLDDELTQRKVAQRKSWRGRDGLDEEEKFA